MKVSAAVYGCAGPRLSEAERRFFAAADPFGFILFARNVESPDQVRSLVAALHQTVSRECPVLIDQEGGRVARLGPPHWRHAPAAERFGRLAARDRAAAVEAARLNARLIAAELRRLGIGANCAPVLDLRMPGGHDIVGDRAFSGDPQLVAALGRAFADGLLAGGVVPIMKHIPGHGRAAADSHLDLPVVEASMAELDGTDFVPFRLLHDLPCAMTAHVLYRAIDAERPATVSPTVIAEAIRGRIGFDGLLMSDDLSMQALAGTLHERARGALDAGCDVVLHCNGEMAEMEQVAAAAGPLSEAGVRRAAAVQGGQEPRPIDIADAERRLAALLKA